MPQRSENEVWGNFTVLMEHAVIYQLLIYQTLSLYDGIVLLLRCRLNIRPLKTFLIFQFFRGFQGITVSKVRRKSDKIVSNCHSHFLFLYPNLMLGMLNNKNCQI